MFLDGYCSSLVTPFGDDFAIDDAEIGRLVEWTLDQGVSSVIAAGSTGESYSLSAEEKAHVINLAVREAAGAVPVIGGATGFDQEDTEDTIRRVQMTGADALMLSCPPIGRLSQDEVVEYFTRCSRVAELPIIVYNAPDDVVTDILPETVVRLAELPGVVALKESSHDASRLHENLVLNGRRLSVYGDVVSPIGLEWFRYTGAGLGYMGSGCLLGKDMAGYFAALQSQDWKHASEIAHRHVAIREKLRGEGFNGRFASMPAQVKGILHLQMGMSLTVRPPRTRIPDISALSAVLETAASAGQQAT